MLLLGSKTCFLKRASFTLHLIYIGVYDVRNSILLALLSINLREERFRQTSENTNSRVLWWSIAQTIVLLLTGAWQMRHLKGFFEAKKLV